MKLEIRNFSCWSICKYYEQVYPSRTPRFSYTFLPGIYALTGQINNGGWAFTYALSPYRKNKRNSILYGQPEYNPEYYIDDQPVNMETLREMTCVLGQYRPRWYAKLGFRDESGGSRLKKALTKGNTGHTYEELVDKLELDEGRLSRRIDHTGNERWRITMAIGLAEGRKIFCYPWMTSSEFKIKPYTTSMMGKLIAADGGILLIPIENDKYVKDIACDIIDLSQPEIFGGEGNEQE